MHKHLILLTATLPLLGACANGNSAPPPTPSLTVGFADDNTASRMGSPVIEIKAANPQPLVTAELVSAGGSVVASAAGTVHPSACSAAAGAAAAAAASASACRSAAMAATAVPPCPRATSCAAG